MVVFAVCFTSGVWLLQKQAALPDIGWAWLLLAAMPFIMLIPSAGTPWLRFARVLPIAAGAGPGLSSCGLAGRAAGAHGLACGQSEVHAPAYLMRRRLHA
ncbi:MAG TPA: hypothetical protein VGD24_06340 [Gallionella sp.]